MRAVTTSKNDNQTAQLKTKIRNIGEKLTDGEKRPWHLEMAISVAIFFLGTAILLTSTNVI